MPITKSPIGNLKKILYKNFAKKNFIDAMEGE
jgi:hypothetical protein